jgi:CheY-like chemotaxis protein
MTADAFAEDIHRFLDAGMNDHIPKPIDPNVLYGVLCKALSGEEGRRISRAER